MGKRLSTAGATLVLLFGLIKVVAVHTEASNAAAISQATKAAEAWLKLVDEEQCKQSWESASSIFKNAITDDQWEQWVTAVREPLGKIVSRKLKSAHYATSLPGAQTVSTSSLNTLALFRTRNPRWRQ
jgi:hypothetical protein